MENPYLPISGKVLKVIDESPNIKSFTIEPERPFSFLAGQFIELTVPGVGEAPFTPSSSPFDKERMEVTIMNVGRVTSALHKLKEGDEVGIRGPYGKPYPLEEFEGKEILLVGGGVGIAPLRALFLSLTQEINKYKKVVFCCGARTYDDLIYKEALLGRWQDEFGQNVCLRITLDIGDKRWKGKVGVVTTTLEDINKEISDIKTSKAVVCGPPVMMKFTTFKLVDVGYQPSQIYLSMEKNMSCGIGKCGHCILGKYYVCKDGPVFTYDMIKDIPGIWD